MKMRNNDITILYKLYNIIVRKMEENIFEPDESFKFNNLILTSPIVVSGGNYFIKFLVDKSPLYIQAPKCITKQGISKAGKKYCCDLMFTNENESFIRWMEDLENYCQDYIFKNREQWFETDLEKHDIENSFTSPLKLFKSGKYYISRTNVPTRLGKCILKIYDENENDVNIEDIKDSTNIITILEIQGIKCSARSFQIEIEIKQMMVLKPSKLFEKCIIKGSSKIQSMDPLNSINTLADNDKEHLQEDETNESIKIDTTNNLGNHYDENDESYQEVLPISTNNSQNINIVLETKDEDFSPTERLMGAPLDTGEREGAYGGTVGPPYLQEENTLSSINNKTNNTEFLEEIEFNLDNIGNDSINLKKRNDVYYEMYREARRKAKLARNLALSAYLEAKKIKNMYMLDEINENDDQSESDLEDDSLNFENENETE